MLGCIINHAQSVNGTWSGKLNLNGLEINVVFHVTETEDGFVTTMDYPAQNVYGLSTTSTKFSDSIITIYAEDTDLHFEGRLMKDNTIKGIFTQMDTKHFLELNHAGVRRSARAQNRR